MKLDFNAPFEIYFKLADASTREAIQGNAEAFDLIEKIHKFCHEDLAPSIVSGSPTKVLLAANSLMVWLASIRTASTGHQASTFPLFRASLESVCYAYLIWTDTELERIWLDRHNSLTAQRACRRTFTSAVKETAKHLAGRDFVWSGTEDWINSAYENAIDFGAHPNPKSILPTLRVDDQRDDGMIGVSLAGIFGGTAFETRRLLLAAIEYGQLIALIAAFSTKEPEEHVLIGLDEINEQKEAIVRSEFGHQM